MYVGDSISLTNEALVWGDLDIVVGIRALPAGAGLRAVSAHRAHAQELVWKIVDSVRTHAAEKCGCHNALAVWMASEGAY